MKYNIIIEKIVIKLREKYNLCKDATVGTLVLASGVSKLTVHKDLIYRLKELDRRLYEQIKLETNKEERHFCGGTSTKKKSYRLKIILKYFPNLL